MFSQPANALSCAVDASARYIEIYGQLHNHPTPVYIKTIKGTVLAQTASVSIFSFFFNETFAQPVSAVTVRFVRQFHPHMCDVLRCVFTVRYSAAQPQPQPTAASQAPEDPSSGISTSLPPLMMIQALLPSVLSSLQASIDRSIRAAVQESNEALSEKINMLTARISQLERAVSTLVHRDGETQQRSGCHNQSSSSHEL